MGGKVKVVGSREPRWQLGEGRPHHKATWRGRGAVAGSRRQSTAGLQDSTYAHGYNSNGLWAGVFQALNWAPPHNLAFSTIWKLDVGTFPSTLS